MVILMIFAGAVIASCLIAFGFATGVLFYRQKHRTEEEPETDEAQLRLDRQWEALYKYDGRES